MSDISVEDVGDHVGVVCLHRPPNNYFDTPLLQELVEAYEELAASSWCRSIVLAAEGRHFCAGLDFSSNAGQDIGELYGYAARLFAAPLPVVAAVHGAAVGGGLGLALSADFRVAASTSRFSANFARLGFHHGFALTVTLPRAVGQQAAADLLFTGRRINGDDARAIGLCDRLVDEADVRSVSVEWARAIAASGPLAVRAIRATLRDGLVHDVGQAMDREHTEQERLRVTKDFAEGIAASNARREPRFTGE